MKLNVFHIQYAKNGAIEKAVIIAKNEGIVQKYAKNRFGDNVKILSCRLFDSNKLETSYDRFSYAEEQRLKAKETSKNYDYIVIRYGGAWGASTYDGKSFCTAYETLGLHANTKDLLEAWYNLDLPIVDYSGIFGRGKHK